MAFGYVKNPANFNELMPSVRFTDVVLTPGGTGTTYRFETRLAGLPVRGGGEYTEVEVNRRIHDETSIGMEGSFDYLFEPERDGVRVTVEHFPGRFWGVPRVGKLLADTYAREDRRVLEHLKDKLEAQAS